MPLGMPSAVPFRAFLIVFSQKTWDHLTDEKTVCVGSPNKCLRYYLRPWRNDLVADKGFSELTRSPYTILPIAFAFPKTPPGKPQAPAVHYQLVVQFMTAYSAALRSSAIATFNGHSFCERESRSLKLERIPGNRDSRSQSGNRLSLHP